MMQLRWELLVQMLFIINEVKEQKMSLASPQTINTSVILELEDRIELVKESLEMLETVLTKYKKTKRLRKNKEEAE